MIKFVTAFLIILLFSGNALSEDWLYVAPAATGDAYFVIDMDSIKEDEDMVVSFLTRIIPNSSDQYLYGTTKFTEDERAINCVNKTSKTLTIRNYGKNGELLGTSTYRQKPFEPIKPGSITETIYNIVCY